VRVWKKGEMEKSKINHNKDENTSFYLGELETEMIMKSQSDELMKSSLKKSTLSKRLANRDIVGNTSRNPYLIGNDYLEDLRIQDTFLRPKNSGFEDLKKE